MAPECNVDWDALLVKAILLGRAVARRLARPPSAERFASFRYRRRDALGRVVDSGTGACMFRKHAGRWAAGHFSWSPCHGYSPFLGMLTPRPRQVPMCPRAVPVALVVVHKAATTSAIHWAASLDEVAMQTAFLIGELTDCICASPRGVGAGNAEALEASNASLAHGIALELVRPWLHYLGAVPREHVGEVDHGLMPLLGSCEDVWLPSMYCPSCCAAGRPHPRRLHLAFARNPYRRFASAYAWLRGDPERFPYFVERFHQLWAHSRGLLLADPGRWLPNGTLDFPWDWGSGFGPGRPWLRTVEVFHFRSAHREMLDAFAAVLPRHGGSGSHNSSGLQVHVVHLETLEEEWPEILGALCRDHGFCSPLPTLPTLNAKGRSEWRESWGVRVQRLLREMLAEDFRVFGYCNSPWEPLPARAGVLRLELP